MKFLKPRSHATSNLHHRFVARVLTPPFVVLLLLGVVIIWQLNAFVRDQAVANLNRATTTTASKLEREFALRQKVLTRTGEEIQAIKSTYQSSLKQLEQDRTECSAHIRQRKPFQSAPNNACQPFLASFADTGANAQAIENGYISVGQQLVATQKAQINERLTSYGQFFPETVALVITDSNGAIISSALNQDFKGSVEAFRAPLETAKKSAVHGQLISAAGKQLAVFAYPGSGYGVLAAYDLASNSFLKESWESTPIDRARALAIILDSHGQTAYPTDQLGSQLAPNQQQLRTRPFAELRLNNLSQIATGTVVNNSNWLVVVASPRTVVLAPVRDAQIAAALIIGALLVAFLWVGTFFIQRTLQSIIRLVSGAVVFSAGNLDYRIQLDNADEEFTSLASTMNSMAERIATAEKEMDERNKEFISIATHELRTPLTAIMGNLSMATDDFADKLDPALAGILGEAQKGTTRLRDLVNDMLDIARLEGGRTEFVAKPQDMGALAHTIIDTLQVTAKEKGITLTYEPDHAATVLADESKLRIILNNFVSNAIKYNRPNGTVTVSHSIDGEMLVTAIADTGLGIPEDQKAHMFEKFFRVKHDDRKSVVGTGLGMYITKEYIVAMGGKLRFESVHGKGTTFYFSLPLVTLDKQSIGEVITPDAAPHSAEDTI